METGGECHMEDLAVSIGEYTNLGGQYQTNNFLYAALMNNPGAGEDTDTLWATAQYRKEDVCLCYLRTGEIVVNQLSDFDYWININDVKDIRWLHQNLSDIERLKPKDQAEHLAKVKSLLPDETTLNQLKALHELKPNKK